MNQVEYLQEQWRCLVREFKGDRIALYGAGRHTTMMLHAIATNGDQPPVVAVLRDRGHAAGPRQRYADRRSYAELVIALRTLFERSVRPSGPTLDFVRPAEFGWHG